MKRLVLYIIGLLLVCTSCERRIEYNGEIAQPRLVMQAEVGEGDTIVRVYVSRSRFFLESGSDLPDDYLMPDAQTELQRGEGEWQAMQWSPADKAFVLKVSPLQVGETIRVRASHPDYTSIAAEQKVVYKPLCWVQFYNGQENTLMYNKHKRYIELNMLLQNYILTDDVTLGFCVTCQYSLIRNTFPPDIKLITSSYLQSFDEIFASADNMYSSEVGFNSRFELFLMPGYPNAKLTELRIPLFGPANWEDYELSVKELNIRFSAHNEDSYLYRKSMYAAFETGRGDEPDIGAVMNDMLGSEEPVQIYTNIANGYGIFAACSRYSIDLKNLKLVEF